VAPRSGIIYVIIGVIVIAAIAAGYFLLRGGTIPVITQSAVAQGSRVEFTGGAGAVWYEANGNNLTPVSGPSGFDAVSVKVLEAAPALPSGDRPVLAQVPGQGVALGILRGSLFIPILSDGTDKEALFVRPDGIAVFAVPAPVASTAPAKGAQPPIILTNAPARAHGWNIEMVNLGAKNPTAKLLAAGLPIGISGNGSVLAVTAEGVTSIGLGGGPSGVIVSSASPVLSGALSADGTMLAVVNPLTHAADVYAVNPSNPAGTTYRFSTSKGAQSVAFSGGTLLVRTEGTVAAYTLTGATSLPSPATLIIRNAPAP
jgi:hypothetical protein